MNNLNISVLMVGVGGIGCEVLKMVSKFTFKEFHIIDMDTIEVSNLNRQFLFKMQHRGQSKALVAKETMLRMAPQLNIVPHFAAVGTPGYGLQFFQQFDAVIMALDNAETRSFVNKVCRALRIYLVDAGSMGFKGQANQYHYQSECYDCFPVASTQKQYPACTIRSQPSNCVHCVIWGKYLFQQLFTEVTIDDESAILEMKVDKKNPKEVYENFFQIECKMKPTIFQVKDFDANKTYSIEELQNMWFTSFSILTRQNVVFDKDNKIHMLFIYSAAVLRSHQFKIEPYEYQKIKTIAGNIIHAIASTNSIVAALEISKLLRHFSNPPKIFQELSGATYISTGKKERILTVKAQRRNAGCSSCFERQGILNIDFDQQSLKNLVDYFKIILNLECINLVSQARLIWDEEEEEMIETMSKKQLKELFAKESDNRIIVKNGEEQLMLVVWLIHKGEQIDFQLIEKQKEVLEEVQRKRVREPQLPRKELQEVKINSPVEIEKVSPERVLILD